MMIKDMDTSSNTESNVKNCWPDGTPQDTYCTPFLVECSLVWSYLSILHCIRIQWRKKKASKEGENGVDILFSFFLIFRNDPTV